MRGLWPSSPERHVDHSEQPSRSTRTSIRRVGAFVALAAVALSSGNWIDPRWLALVLLFAALVEGVIYFLVPVPAQSYARIVVDTVMVATLTVIDVAVWPVAIVAMVAATIWQALQPRGNVLWASTAGLVVVAAVGGIRDADAWGPISLTAVIVALFYGLMSRGEHDAARRSTEDLMRVLRASESIAYSIDLETERFTSFAGPIEDITGWTEQQWTTMSHQRIIHPDDFDGFWIDVAGAELAGSIDRKARFRRPDGTYVWLRDISRVVRQGGRYMLYGFTVDVSELQDAYQTIRHQADHDDLTGVSNRRVLTGSLAQRLADKRGTRGSFALLTLDINRFKEINDSFGHEVGDAVLCEVASRLRECVRPEDVLARAGGDEFVVVADHVYGMEQAEAVANRVIASCAAPFTVQSIEIDLRVSLGIALADDVDDPEELLRRADVAKQRAKHNGVGFVVFVGDTEGEGISEIALASSLPAAIEQNQFEMWFQPKVDMNTGQVVGAEGLVRWNNPDLGLLQPKTFLHLVELSNSNRDFTEMVFDQGIRFVRDAGRAGRNFRVALNVSIRSLYDDTFPGLISSLLKKYNVDASSLILEITEQEIMDDASGQAPPALVRLAEMGITLSIDDFGTGYSSLARLRDLPVSEIKIDQRFVGSGPEDDDDRVIIHSIIDLAENLGLHVVAEGVERGVEVEMLVSAGCTHAQGFLYGKPMPVTSFLRWVGGSELRVIEGGAMEREETA